MTPAQQKALDRIKAEIVRQKSNGKPETSEFKKFEVTDGADTPLVFLVTEYGMKGDEGTMAALMCRDYRHFMIGKRGGVELLSLVSNLRSSYPKRVRGAWAAVTYWHPPKKDSHGAPVA
jgi:hypothetical protein